MDCIPVGYEASVVYMGLGVKGGGADKGGVVGGVI